jgi:hypothetical protein
MSIDYVMTTTRGREGKGGEGSSLRKEGRKE